MEILHRQVKRLRNKEVYSFIIFSRNHLAEGASLKVEADMKSPYPHISPSTPIPSVGNLKYPKNSMT